MTLPKKFVLMMDFDGTDVVEEPGMDPVAQVSVGMSYQWCNTPALSVQIA